MKTGSAIFLVSIFLGAGYLANAQSVSKCFRADWLQGERTVNFRANGNKVAGAFTVGSGDNDPSRTDATYEFGGTLRGNTLVVAFVGNRLPDVAPSEMKSLIWTLVKSADKESLRIKFSGKNYETNKYEVRFADFESCQESYAELARSARQVRFARGTNSASFPVLFQTKRETKTFLLNMKAGQKIAVAATGCGISFYYPDKRAYEEGTAIDTWGSDGLTQGGDYLFVIRPAPEPGKCSVIFKVTN